MAVNVRYDDRLLRRAIVASLGLHLLLALLVPNWLRSQSQDLQPIESLTFARLIRMEVSRPAASAPERAQVRAQHRSAVATFAHVKAELSAPSKRRRFAPRPIAGAPGTAAAAPHAVPRQETPLYARTSSSVQPEAAVQHAPAATPAPAAAAGERDVNGASSDRGGVMPFGAAQDPVLDPRVLAALQQKVTVHVTLRVRVGEDGRTLGVDFDPPLDAQTERSIQDILAQADWDAAICGGGVSCEGVAVIKL
ncbi:MAG TPA: hypothetical protein VFA29_15515 [Candidatus Baltobacteraceae bacterium]|nr:hypothetical protein [Candidatus Baltobacteraceae bacterium]